MRRNDVNPTHLGCGIVKQFWLCYSETWKQDVLEAGRKDLERREVTTMPAIAEVLPAAAHSPDPRGCELPTCPVCADSMVAAEASAYLSDNIISYLWTCDTCGYGFVTKHALRGFVCN
jgi:hypothetical protein